MNKPKKYIFGIDIVAGFLLIFSFFLIIFIPMNSKSTLWKDYRILFLPMEADEPAILQAAEESGITGIISSQTIESRFTDFEEKGYTGFPFTDKERYAQWFINDQENIRYMYIPSEKYITKTFFRFLKQNTEFFYIENNSPFSIFQFGTALIFFILSFFYTSRKKTYLTAALPFVIYAGFQKGILALSSSILIMYTIAFWIEAIGSSLKFTREQLLSRIKKNPLLVFFPFVALIIAKFNSNISLVLFAFALSVSASMTYIIERLSFFIEERIDTQKIHKTIRAYVMNPESVAKFWHTRHLLIVSSCAVLFIGFSALFLYFSFNKTLKAYKNILYLPVPESSVGISGFSKKAFDELKNIRTGDELPDLGNLISDVWNAKVIPFTRVDLSPQEKDRVSFNDFSVDEKGVVTEQTGLVFSLDDEFIKSVISFRASPSIEDLLYSQGRFITASYAPKKFPLNRYNSAALLVALVSAIMPLMIILLRVFEK
ncbi:hypothetical protein [Treponema putidum]|uniref:Uncharacterized protein n=1 Tax=Treponema putidum TaxID=221027 RepID=A0AAE9MT29_9SPIR|nr:hypothetical protein [Treponema putidum]AIN94322.1 hypothetical protein JO40_09580 [Treponema putidum]TWI79806.1 hypothetical protein JM98_00237 [Treponema putidum]UTY28258.1 hypothetical protein E4N76_04165 [Treponema putidum]UTY30752.1 hypothetical protein E4N75_03750 [Treponema putidum]UTY33172.1 hypothetical protein E4N74_03480 [Treponema putidum]